MKMKPIEIYEDIFAYKNFVNEEECFIIINFINDNADMAFRGQGGKRQTIPLGSVPFEGTIQKIEQQKKIKLKNFPQQVQDITNSFIKKIIREVREVYQDNEPMHASNIFFAKQYGGCIVERHLDSAEWDTHLEYSAVLYFNEIKTGDLVFNDKNISYHPQKGDMLLFKSKDPAGSHEVPTIDSERYSMPIFISKNSDCYIE
jgi:hypothetical protein